VPRANQPIQARKVPNGGVIIATVVVVAVAITAAAWVYSTGNQVASPSSVTLNSFYLHNVYNPPLNSSAGRVYQSICAQGFCNVSWPVDKLLHIQFNLMNNGGSSMTAENSAIPQGFGLGWESPASGPPFQVSSHQSQSVTVNLTLPNAPGTYNPVITLTWD
jgi:hypothetical protein